MTIGYGDITPLSMYNQMYSRPERETTLGWVHPDSLHLDVLRRKQGRRYHQGYRAEQQEHQEQDADHKQVPEIKENTIRSIVQNP
jgi:hypothetical protein